MEEEGEAETDADIEFENEFDGETEEERESDGEAETELDGDVELEIEEDIEFAIMIYYTIIYDKAQVFCAEHQSLLCDLADRMLKGMVKN